MKTDRKKIDKGEGTPRPDDASGASAQRPAGKSGKTVSDRVLEANPEPPRVPDVEDKKAQQTQEQQRANGPESSSEHDEESKPFDFGGLPDRNLKKNLGCG